MTNVVQGKFKQKSETVFQCVNCNGQAFWLDEEGTVTCRTCKAKQLPPKEWIDKALAIIDEDDGEVEE